jgi:hypothetical protein
MTERKIPLILKNKDSENLASAMAVIQEFGTV